MGCFDSVNVRCPHCDKYVEFQSKAGDCCLDTHHQGYVPPEIAKALNGAWTVCRWCNKGLFIYTERQPETVPMFASKVELELD